MKRLFSTLGAFILGFSILTASQAWAQLTPSSERVSFKAVPEQSAYLPGESFRILFELKFEENWHGQSNKPSLDSLIPTVLEVTSDSGISFGRVAYPPGDMEEFEFTKEKLSTYKNTVYIGVSGAVPADMKPGDYMAVATLTVQACDNIVCLIPSDISIDVPLNVVAAGSETAKINTEIFTANESVFSGSPTAESDSGMADIGAYVEGQGMLIAFFIIFLGGLALNLTPCVYPLIPITISYFGGRADSKKAHIVIHALLYLLGMAVMYSILGVVAALTGSLFGALLTHWAVILFIAVVLIGLSLSMFGLYDIQPPAFLINYAGQNREGYGGTFMMGLTAGVIMAPCIGPFVIGLLTFVGERGDPMLGFTMFFTLALGLGTPFVFLAIFSGSVTKLPRSGLWMVWVKQAFGFILIGMAIYFMEPLIPESVYLPLMGVFVVGAGLYLGLASKVEAVGKVFKTIKAAVAIAGVAGGVALIALSQASEAPGIMWTKATAAAIEEAAKSGKPVIMDFTADWCLPCKELEHFTFKDERVVELSKKFANLKADMTKSGDPDAEEMKKRFDVVGVPTILFLDAKGSEMKALRFFGFVDADDFLGRMEKALE